MKDVAAIVVTFNRKALLVQNIEHLLKQTPYTPDIIIIDNNSTDGTKEELMPYIENGQIQYFNTGANLGGAGGFSYGMRLATEKGYPYIWVMDDDSFPEPNALDMLMQANQKLNGNYGFLSSRVLWKDQSICVMNRQKVTKWQYVKDYEKMQQVQYATFVSLFLKREIIVEMGLPYKEFFIWGDDWEYTRRIAKKYPCYYVPESIVNHWCNTNFGANIVMEDRSRLERYRYTFRNDVVLYRQDGLEGSLYMFLRVNVLVMRILLKADYKKEKLEILFSSLRNGTKFYPEIEYPKSGSEKI